MGLIAGLIIGGLSGLAAGKIMRGGGFGIVVNIIVGILGGVLGGWLFGMLGISMSGGWIGSLITSVVGACVLLWLVSIISPSKKS